MTVYQYGNIQVIYYPVGVLIRVYTGDKKYRSGAATWKRASMEGDCE